MAAREEGQELELTPDVPGTWSEFVRKHEAYKMQTGRSPGEKEG